MADTEFVHAISAGIGCECSTSPKPCSAVSLQIEQPLIQNDANAGRVVELPHTLETVETHGWDRYANVRWYNACRCDTGVVSKYTCVLGARRVVVRCTLR